MDAKVVKLESEIRLKADRETVWRAFTDDGLEWYPHTYGRDRVRSVVCEHHVGGRQYEDWGDGLGHLYATIVHYDSPAELVTRGFLESAITMERATTFVQDGEFTVMKSTMTCFGPIGPEMEEGIRTHGDLSLFEDALRAYVEEGISIRV